MLDDVFLVIFVVPHREDEDIGTLYQIFYGLVGVSYTDFLKKFVEHSADVFSVVTEPIFKDDKNYPQNLHCLRMQSFTVLRVQIYIFKDLS
jgi:hypothetical protein